MKQDKWTQQLHDKLADYQTDAPEGLWDDIEAALQTQAKPQEARFISLRQWIIAACLASFLATGGYMWYHSANESESNQNATELADAKKDIIQNNPVESDNDNVEEEIPVKQGKILVRHNPQLIAEAENDVNVSVKHDSIIYQTTENAPQEQLAETPSVPAKEDEIIRELDKVIHELSKNHKNTVSLNLYAMNGFGTQASSNGVLMSEGLLQKFNNDYSYASATRAQSPAYLSGYEERQKHYQPISLGISVGYPLTKVLSITTGVAFTRLRSDFLYTTQNQQINKEQKLYYFGIPLQINAQIWSYKGLKAYLSAGGQADWNISTSLESNGIAQELDKDKMQWSVNTSLGIEYDIIPQLGIYIEPGLKHYFDNGSRIENFFKDKPTNFNLQVGVRWNILK